MDCRECKHIETDESKEPCAGCDGESNHTPKEVKKTCRDCENSNVISFDKPCNSCYSIVSKLHLNFTPKIKPDEKPEKSCKTCRHSFVHGNSNKPCLATDRICTALRAWQPIEKPGQATISPKESKDKDCEECRYYYECAGEDTLIKAINCVKYKPKRKEVTMIKKVRHLMRMAAMLWLAVGVWKICVFANPLILQVGAKILSLNGKFAFDPSAPKPTDIVVSWIILLSAFAIVAGISYALNRFTKWFFGEK